MTRSERGAQIRKARQQQKLSTYRAAVVVGVHPNSILLAERGATSEAMLERIAKALGVGDERGRS